MSSTGQPSSSRRKEKDPMERLTPLQEKELENASLRQQVRNFQQEIDEVRTKYEDLEAEQKAKHEVIERLNEVNKRLSIELSRRKLDNESLSMKLANRDWEIDSYKERAVQQRGYLDDLYGPIPLAASKKAETKERANPQLEQSGLHKDAEELESQKTSKDITEEEFKTVEVKKKKPTDGSGSKATVSIRSLSNTNYFQALDEDKAGKKRKEPKKADVPKQNPADKRYVVPPPEKVKSNEQSRAGLIMSTPWSIPSSAPETNFSTLTSTSIWGPGDRHGFKTLHSQEDTPMVQTRSALQAPKSPPRPRNSPQPEHVRSLATPHGAESVKDYAQVAATPARPTSGGTSDSWDTFWENYSKRYGVKVDVAKWYADFEQQHAAKSSKPGEDQTRGVDGSSNSKSGQLKAATLGDKVIQSADEDVLDQGSPRLAKELKEDGSVEATRESKQPDFESTKAKRSFSQSFSEPDLSQKKTKIDRK